MNGYRPYPITKQSRIYCFTHKKHIKTTYLLCTQKSFLTLELYVERVISTIEKVT